MGLEAGLSLMHCQWFPWPTEVWTTDCAGVEAALGLGHEAIRWSNSSGSFLVASLPPALEHPDP